MGLNNIQLKPNLLADLYKNSLIETVATDSPEKTGLKHLGNNRKNTLVIVSHDSVRYIPDGELSFLTNVLSACQLSIADIAIINSKHTEPGDLKNFIDKESKNVLLFGIAPLSIGLPINFPAFQLQAFDNRTYIHTPSLSEIENDKKLKTRLWTSLKTLFGI